ncbi:MAG: alpha,alpha-trehalose-phosphate synthase (UDP-forming) [Acidimicrobiales bacterium]
MPPVVMVSNRGPLSFGRADDGTLALRPGGGGLVSSLGPLLAATGGTWVAAAMSQEDREALAQGLMEVEGLRLRVLDIDPATFAMAYDVVSNATLWFLHHGLFDLARRPRFDRRWTRAWEAYVEVNAAFAGAVAEVAPEDAVVLVQDYHLALVGGSLARARPDLRVVHFSHTPFADPSAIRVLPGAVAEELLGGMVAGVACGFHNSRWAEAFEACCDDVLGETPATFVAPLGPDPVHLARMAASREAALRSAWVDTVAGDRQLLVRVDRLDPAKNLLRGFLAYEELLASHAEVRGRVTFLAIAYPSRERLPEYLGYRAEVESLVERINRTWGDPGWTPVVLSSDDDHPRSVAALRRYDVLLVNSVRDGLNLVAKEGPLLNATDGVLALSREAGAWAELGPAALEVNPFDVHGTADVLARALCMAPADRSARSAALREAAGRRTPRDWLEDQLLAGGS